MTVVGESSHSENASERYHRGDVLAHHSYIPQDLTRELLSGYVGNKTIKTIGSIDKTSDRLVRPCFCGFAFTQGPAVILEASRLREDTLCYGLLTQLPRYDLKAGRNDCVSYCTHAEASEDVLLNFLNSLTYIMTAVAKQQRFKRIDTITLRMPLSTARRDGIVAIIEWQTIQSRFFLHVGFSTQDTFFSKLTQLVENVKPFTQLVENVEPFKQLVENVEPFIDRDAVYAWGDNLKTWKSKDFPGPDFKRMSTSLVDDLQKCSGVHGVHRVASGDEIMFETCRVSIEGLPASPSSSYSTGAKEGAGVFEISLETVAPLTEDRGFGMVGVFDYHRARHTCTIENLKAKLIFLPKVGVKTLR